MMRIGVDLGGTKTVCAALNEEGEIQQTIRAATPRGEYGATLTQIKDMVFSLEAKLGGTFSTGIGIPGSLIPSSGLVQNANSTWLNDQPFARDISDALCREVRVANDANCFALSEAIDGAGQGAPSVFGVILGTGVGGGLIYNGEIINGPRSTGGEWGHVSLPFLSSSEREERPCWCGKTDCIESFVSGPALTELFNEQSCQPAQSVEEIVALANRGDEIARDCLDCHSLQVAKALSIVVTLFDPHVIVLGGGLSNLTHLYEELPHLILPYLFTNEKHIDIRPPRFGAASGVRGAARLWTLNELNNV